MTREETLKAALNCVNGERDQQYGKPENNFGLIARLWSDYLFALPADRTPHDVIDAADVAAMMALLKIARIATGTGKSDNWIDLAGYAACGCEIETEGRE